jgi:hypothetical protein
MAGGTCDFRQGTYFRQHFACTVSTDGTVTVSLLDELRQQALLSWSLRHTLPPKVQAPISRRQ